MKQAVLMSDGVMVALTGQGRGEHKERSSSIYDRKREGI